MPINDSISSKKPGTSFQNQGIFSNGWSNPTTSLESLDGDGTLRAKGWLNKENPWGYEEKGLTKMPIFRNEMNPSY